MNVVICRYSEGSSQGGEMKKEKLFALESMVEYQACENPIFSMRGNFCLGGAHSTLE